MYQYHLYGLNIASELAFDWPECDKPAAIDVNISLHDELSAIEFEYTGVACQWQCDHWRFSLPGVGVIVVRNGRKIDLYPEKSTCVATMSCFIEHPALSALLLQRKQVSLHGAVIAYDDKHAFGLLSVVPCGKSSLAYTLSNQGWPVVSDGVVVPTMIERQACVMSGATKVTLWQDSCQRLDINIDETALIRPGSKQYEVPVLTGSKEGCQLTHLFVLQSTRIEQDQYIVQQGLNAFRVLQQHVVGEPWLRGMGIHKDIFVQLAALASSVSIHRILTQKQDCGERVLAQIQSVLAESKEPVCV